ncbi:MAG: tetratricopeptide repeat protein [Cyanobacteria bacterium P01_A01_bin.37]
MRDRYLELIDHIIATTLKGQIRSKEQVYRMLKDGIEAGTGEIFERCLQERVDDIHHQLEVDDELKQAKAERKQRALKTIQSEWTRWQHENQGNTALDELLHALIVAEPEDRLIQVLQTFDPNQGSVLSREQMTQLAQRLDQSASNPDEPIADVSSLMDLAAGLRQGLLIWDQLEGEVVGWIFDQRQRSLGFEGIPDQVGPWGSWAKRISHPGIQALFQDLAVHQSVTEQSLESPMSLADWVAMAMVLQRLNLGLIHWFDHQPYDMKAGKRLSIATYLSFTVVWSQLSNRFEELEQELLSEGCFQMALQALSQFAQQDYFPLYGGLFTALSDESFHVAIEYLDQPLREAPNTRIKARILTLLGYSQRALGDDELALDFHEDALEIAREAGDRPCEIANLNHLSRTYVMLEDYEEAIDNGQRALILARQTGDRLGEANALANIGVSEVLLAQEEEQIDEDRYERILGYVKRGLTISEQVGDRPSQALCVHSLGVAQVVLGQYHDAIISLERGLTIADAIGDLFFQGLNFSYLAEAYRGLDNIEQAIIHGCIGMYWLHQIESELWRQPAGVVSILQGQLGEESFREKLQIHRPQFLKQIGVDGFDFLLTLLSTYRQSLDDSTN